MCVRAQLSLYVELNSICMYVFGHAEQGAAVFRFEQPRVRPEIERDREKAGRERRGILRNVSPAVRFTTTRLRV